MTTTTRPPLIGHHALHNRFHIGGTLTLESPLRLSSGRANDETDAPVMRGTDGVPYIPGTSLRGALRAWLERMLACAPGYRSCTLFERDESSEACLTASRSKQQKLQEILDDPGKGELDALGYIEAHLCDVCRLFGSTHFAGKLVVDDARAVGDANAATRIRDGVGIDRDTGTAAHNIKFDYEVVETESTFPLSLWAENLTPHEGTLVQLLIHALQQGEIVLGGKRGGGFGRVQLGETVEVQGFTDPEDHLNKLLLEESGYSPLTLDDLPATTAGEEG